MDNSITLSELYDMSRTFSFSDLKRIVVLKCFDKPNEIKSADDYTFVKAMPVVKEVETVEN